jgi:hypothetical protein
MRAFPVPAESGFQDMPEKYPHLFACFMIVLRGVVQ